MKLYLAGPMSGYKDHNYPAFHAAAARLRAAGHQVINPAELNPENEGMQGITPKPIWRNSMKRDLPQLLTCDAVAVLPDWEKSRGARLEVFVAATLGMTIFLEIGQGMGPPSIQLHPFNGGKVALIKELLEYPRAEEP